MLQRNFLWSNTKAFFLRTSEHLSITLLNGKFVQIQKKSALFDHMILDGHKASFDISLLLKENHAFKLQLKESLLLSWDKPILNKNIYSIPLELHDLLYTLLLLYLSL